MRPNPRSDFRAQRVNQGANCGFDSGMTEFSLNPSRGRQAVERPPLTDTVDEMARGAAAWGI